MSDYWTRHNARVRRNDRRRRRIGRASFALAAVLVVLANVVMALVAIHFVIKYW